MGANAAWGRLRSGLHGPPDAEGIRLRLLPRGAPRARRRPGKGGPLRVALARRESRLGRRRPHVHIRHDGQAQGSSHNARQHPGQHRLHRRVPRAPRRRPDARHPALLLLLRHLPPPHAPQGRGLPRALQQLHLPRDRHRHDGEAGLHGLRGGPLLVPAPPQDQHLQVEVPAEAPPPPAGRRKPPPHPPRGAHRVQAGGQDLRHVRPDRGDRPALLSSAGQASGEARLDREGPPRHRALRHRRGREARRPGPGRRDRREGQEHLARLLQRPRGDRREIRRGRAPHGRPRHRRRRGLHLHRRPQGRLHQKLGLPRLEPGGGILRPRPPRRRVGGRGRRPRSRGRRGHPSLRHPPPRLSRRRGRGHGPLPRGAGQAHGAQARRGDRTACPSTPTARS